MKFVTRRALDTGDVSQDFKVELDTDMPMIYAYKEGTGDWTKHDRYGIWSMQFSSTGVSLDSELDEDDLRELLRDYTAEAHGWAMWSAWYVVGLLMLITKRYAKKTWKLNHFVHAILGYLILIVTLVYGFNVAKYEFSSLHQTIGLLFLPVALIGALSGSFTAGTMVMYKGDKDWSEKERIERVAKIHRYFGYTMLFLGMIVVSTGINHYFDERLLGDDRKILSPISALTFAFLVFLFEAIYRLRNKYALGHIKTSEKTKSREFTPEEVDTAVEKGRPLVIFDNLVLDIKDYHLMHPGGKFNLTHNYARDISKFFFGGYSLVQVKGKWPHHHSQSALDIVKSMTVGVISG